MNPERVDTRANKARQLATNTLNRFKNAFSFGNPREISQNPDNSPIVTRRTFLASILAAAGTAAISASGARGQEPTEGDQPPVEANDPEPSRQPGPRPKPNSKPGGPPRNKPQGEPYEGPNPPETSEQVDVGPKGSSGEFTAAAAAAGPEAPKAGNFRINQPDLEKPLFTLEQAEKPSNYTQATIDAINNTNNPALIKYADLLIAREEKRNYRDEGIPNGRYVIHAISFFDSSHEFNPAFPYWPASGAAGELWPNHVTQSLGVFEKRMGEPGSPQKPFNPAELEVPYPPESLTAILSFVYTEAFNTKMAEKIAQWLMNRDSSKRLTPQQIDDLFKDSSSVNPDILEASAFAINETLLTYEHSKDDLTQAGILTSSYFTDIVYPQWKPIANLPEGPEKQQALQRLAKQRFFAS